MKIKRKKDKNKKYKKAFRKKYPHFKFPKSADNDSFFKYHNLSEKITEHSNKLPLPLELNHFSQIDSHSWFNINEYDTKTKEVHKFNFFESSEEKNMNCRKIRFYPTEEQKIILNQWFKSATLMYNCTIKYFKDTRFLKQKYVLNWKKLRTNILKDVRNTIIDESQVLNFNRKTKVNSHVLDFVIQNACANFKSMLTNLRNGNIKHFRLRYQNQDRPNCVIKIEKAFIHPSKNTFCSSIFKEEFKCDQDYKLQNIVNDFNIQYNRLADEYHFLVPKIVVNDTKFDELLDSCGLDPGLRVFLTGFSSNKSFEIGNNLINEIKHYLNKIDSINNDPNFRPIKKDKITKKYRLKINNKVNDMHWKTIKYLTDNFNDILIGNLSTKGIINNKKENQLDKMMKRVASSMSLYKFKQRLAYKCKVKNKGYKEVDEAYSTKTCTNCGFLNDHITTEKRIRCLFCKTEILRDINGARNIYLDGF